MVQQHPLVSASILSADFAQLGQEVSRASQAGSDRFHLDVMDGHFVANLTFGPPVIKALRRFSALPFDAHLMVENPSSLFKDFQDAGVNSLTIHWETCPHLEGDLCRLRDMGLEPGVALNPSTPVSVLRHITHVARHVVIMTVNPGFGGQQFIPQILPKIQEARDLFGPDVHLHVDGGVKKDNAREILDAGADVLVAGSFVYGASDMAEAIRSLKGNA